MGKNTKTYISGAYKIIMILGLAMHASYTCVFAFMKMQEMCIYNACITLVYVLFYWLVCRERYRLAVTLVHLEVCEFVIVSTLLLGWHYGFTFYLISLSALVYFNPFKHKNVIYLFPCLELVSFFILKLWTADHPPVFASNDLSSTFFAYFNPLGCFMIILLGAQVSGITLQNIRKERDYFAYDPLTGTYRREYFIKQMETTLRENPDKKYVLLVTNIVGLKFYNEIFGEEMGDAVLKAEAEMLKGMQKANICYGRVAGDEFAILMETDKFNASCLLKHVNTIEAQFSSDLYRMHIHVGIYYISMEESVSIMLDKAEIAIRSLQGEYGACHADYTTDMLDKSLQERRVLSEFDQALTDGQFCFYLQPQFSRKGDCLGAEALVRWTHPIKGLIPPLQFIPILERTGLIWKLDQYIWEEAAKKLKEWQSGRDAKIFISVNISPKDFIYLDIYAVFTALVEKYQISPKSLKLEITETAFLEDTGKQLALIDRLQEYGFDIEIDDFGSGFSSLNLLKDIKANILKIDMAFLEERENMHRSWAILKSIVSLASSIGMETITEGVETREQVSRLTEMGCDMFQGFYFSRPVPVDQFEARYL